MKMKKEDCEKIIIEEGLSAYNICENRDDYENEMVIKKYEDKYIVYATDERASKVTGSQREFSNEDDAMQNFLKRLRALNLLKNSQSGK